MYLNFSYVITFGTSLIITLVPDIEIDSTCELKPVPKTPYQSCYMESLKHILSCLSSDDTKFISINGSRLIAINHSEVSTNG